MLPRSHLSCSIGVYTIARQPDMSDNVDSSIAKLLAGVEKGDARLVSVVDEVLMQLEQKKLAWRAHLPPRCVGVHPENRGGYGVSAPEVHRLGAKITAVGWSHDATSHAVAVEDKDRRTAIFMQNLIMGSPGLGKVNPCEIRYGSLGCSHTNQFLVAALCQVETEEQSLAVGGRMSADMLGSRDPRMKEAFSKGLLWLVIAHEATLMYPTLCDLVQSARNSSGAAHHRENSFQIMAKAASIASAMSIANNGVVAWDTILQIVTTRSHASENEVKPILKYIQRYGGGDAGSFASELQEFHKMCVPATRVVSASTFQALADLKLAAKDMPPYFMAAVLKAQALCPEASVDPLTKVCNFISKTDINSLSSGARKTAMLQAEGVLMECRNLAKDHQVSRQTAVRCLGRLDVFMARLVLNKKQEQGFTTVEDVGKNFVKDLLQAGTEVMCPWSQQSFEAAAPSRLAPNFVQYNPDGQAIAPEALALQNSGFFVGTRVKNTTDNTLHEIAQLLEDGSVVLQQLAEGGEAIKRSTVEYSKFVAGFRSTAATVEIMHNWQEKAPGKQTSYVEAKHKAYVLVALAHLGDTSANEVKVQMKPCRTIYSEANFGNGKLVFVPETTKVTATKPASGLSLECIVSVGKMKHSMWLLPSFSDSFASLAWAIRTDDQEDNSNMTVGKKTVHITIDDDKVSVQLPVIQNNKKINVGDELVMYKEPHTKPAKRPPTMMLQQGPSNAKARRVA